MINKKTYFSYWYFIKCNTEKYFSYRCEHQLQTSAKTDRKKNCWHHRCKDNIFVIKRAAVVQVLFIGFNILLVKRGLNMLLCALV